MTSSSVRRKKSIIDDPIHYMRSYEVYAKKSSAHQETAKWIQEKLPDVLKQARAEEKVPETLNILGVGCGEGYGGDLLMLETVADNLHLGKSNGSLPVNVLYQAVDPRSDALAVFHDSARSWKEMQGRLNVSFELIAQTWQEYEAETKQQPTKFHFISFIQSLYYMEAEETLRVCMEERLADSGIILCMNDFARKFYGPKLLPLPDGVTYYTSEDIAAIAEKNEWKYEHYLVEFCLNATDVFDESSVEGNLQLDFMVQTANFRDVTEEAHVQEVMKFLWEQCRLDEGGQKMIPEKVGVVVIFKG